jgi:predicted acetyltransferase
MPAKDTVASRHVIEANRGVHVKRFVTPCQCGGTDALRFRVAFS